MASYTRSVLPWAVVSFIVLSSSGFNIATPSTADTSTIPVLASTLSTALASASSLPGTEGCYHCIYFAGGNEHVIPSGDFDEDGWCVYLANPDVIEQPPTDKPEGLNCRHCGSAGEGTCHSPVPSWLGGNCSNHPTCGRIEGELSFTEEVAAGDVRLLAGRLADTGTRLRYNSERQALQLLDCTGDNVVVHLPVSQKLANALQDIQ